MRNRVNPPEAISCLAGEIASGGILAKIPEDVGLDPPPRSGQVINREVLGQFLEEEAWQIAEIKKGIEAADRGELIPHEEVMARISAKM